MHDAGNPTAPGEKVQLHLLLPYKFHPREHPRIRRYLARGYGIAQLQRLSDREVVVTLVARTQRTS
jgi:hypothetical protein